MLSGIIYVVGTFFISTTFMIFGIKETLANVNFQNHVHGNNK